MRKEIINCLEFEVMVEKLIEMIRPHKDQFDGVYGVPTGGLIPAVYISKRLGLHLFDTYLNKDILIVDDLTDTGKTMRDILNPHKEYEHHLTTTASIFYKPHKPPLLSFKPDFYVRETLNWIVFPWEDPEEKPNREMYEHL